MAGYFVNIEIIQTCFFNKQFFLISNKLGGVGAATQKALEHAPDHL